MKLNVCFLQVIDLLENIIQELLKHWRESNNNRFIFESFIQILCSYLDHSHVLTIIRPLKYCRRPSLLAPSLGLVGTNRSFVCIARPTMTEDNVGFFGLKEMDERRMESGEGLPLSAVFGQRSTSSSTGLRRCPRLVRRAAVLSTSFSEYVHILLINNLQVLRRDLCRCILNWSNLYWCTLNWSNLYWWTLNWWAY